PPVSSNEPSEESHDESHVSKPPEESSEDPQNPLPYKNITSLTYNDIKKDELDSYFENSVFIGNSIMVHFKNYYSNKKASIPGFLGKAQFFCRSNYSAATDMLPIRDDTWQPFVGEEKLNSWDAVAKLGVKKVFINLMALNEIGYNGVDRTIKNTCTMIERIREKSPDVQVIIMSNTYLVKNYNNFEKLFNNDNISKFNNRILQYCNENGLDFIDVSTFLMEGKFLKNEYCIDWELLPNKYGCHLNNNAFAMWTATLRNYAYAKNKGFYKNPSVMPSYTKNG
ncbi:MAG: GDSL-type esterase/lipase family protein, partial [Clostridia bacterium]